MPCQSTWKVIVTFYLPRLKKPIINSDVSHFQILSVSVSWLFQWHANCQMRLFFDFLARGEIWIYEEINDHHSSTHNLSSCVVKAWKKFRLERDLNQWPLRYRCSALPTELPSQRYEHINDQYRYQQMVNSETMKDDIFVQYSTNWAVKPIGHVRYINILTWLRGFRVKLLYLVLFSLYSSLFWELRDKRNFKNLQFWLESLGATLEYWHIERGLLGAGHTEISCTIFHRCIRRWHHLLVSPDHWCARIFLGSSNTWSFIHSVLTICPCLLIISYYHVFTSFSAVKICDLSYIHLQMDSYYHSKKFKYWLHFKYHGLSALSDLLLLQIY